MKSNITIRPASLNDLEQVYSIELNAFLEPYPKELLRLLLFLSPRTFLVVEVNKSVVGYVIGVIRKGYLGHIISVAIEEKFRRKGLGKLLMRTLEDNLLASNCYIFRLEVRESNFIARSLYLALDYKDAYIIPNYYRDGESAIVMFKII